MIRNRLVKFLEHVMDHDNNQYNNNVFSKNQGNVLVREIRMNHEKSPLKTNYNDSKKLELINLEGEKPNVRLVNIFPTTLSREIKPDYKTKATIKNLLDKNT